MAKEKVAFPGYILTSISYGKTRIFVSSVLIIVKVATSSHEVKKIISCQSEGKQNRSG